jgi:hypothetical protein
MVSIAPSTERLKSVLQKSKQVGILKSMGARHRRILRAFLLHWSASGWDTEWTIILTP